MKKGLLILILSLVACTTNQPTDGTAIDDMAVDLHQGIAGNQALEKDTEHSNRMPSAISKALIPGVKMRAPQRNVMQRRFDIAVKDVPARTFFTGLVADTPISIVVSPEITGRITLNLKQVTIEQVLQTLENVYGYSYDPIPSGFEILPNTLKTQIYAVNYLEQKREGRSSMSLSSGEVTQAASTTNTTSGLGASATSQTSSGGGNVNNFANVIGKVETTSTVNFWEQLQKTLTNIIGVEGGRSITVNPAAGVVVVRALPKELKQVEAYLDMVQNSMDRQIMLEAKILEVDLNDQYQMGIDWKIFGADLKAYSDFPGTSIKKDEFPDAFKIGINWNPADFTTTIHALETQGNVQVLSSPRVSTMNNQMSAIKVGSDEFFVTAVTNNNNNSGTVNNANVVNFPSVTLTPFFSGITLDVTPQIDANGDITLHIHPSVSLVTTQRKTIDLGADLVQEYPLAHSTIRESDTIVHAKNGQVVVIGGLMENQTREDIAELPVFGNIPFLGTLFRATKQTSRKSELVILIKPTVINQKSMTKHLIDTTQHFANVKRGFHIGSRPDVFGTEGEEPVSFGPKAGYYGKKPQ